MQMNALRHFAPAACQTGRSMSTSPTPARLRRRRRARGVSLIEILVVVAIMSLLAAAVGVGAYRAWVDSQVKTATFGARTIRSAVRQWWVVGDNHGCPTMADLVQSRTLDEDSPQRDPWGKPWRIECSDDQVSVGSDGPDRERNTPDDVRVPPLRKDATTAAPEDSS